MSAPEISYHETCVCGHQKGSHVKPTGEYVGCGIYGCPCIAFDNGDMAGRLQELPVDILTREDTMRTQGHKDDFGKTNWFAMPWFALEKMAEVMTFGASKYAVFNFRKGMKASRLFSAAQRHMIAWSAGEEIDEESGLPHLAHAMCCIGMLLDLDLIGKLEDDRWEGNDGANRLNTASSTSK